MLSKPERLVQDPKCKKIKKEKTVKRETSDGVKSEEIEVMGVNKEDEMELVPVISADFEIDCDSN